MLPEEVDVVMTHRVTKVNTEAMEFITKGDANEQEDEEPVAFDRLIGKPILCIPRLAVLSDLLNTMTGKVFIFSLFACSFMCWIVADLLSKFGEGSYETKQCLNTGKRKTGKINTRSVSQVIFFFDFNPDFHLGIA